MNSIVSVTLLILLVAGLGVFVVLLVLPLAADWPKISRKARILVAFPSLIMLGLFYSLAAHMYQTLGKWPETIGNRGFPKDLLWHASVAGNIFGGLFFFTLFILPVVFLASVGVKRWRGVIPYLSAHAISFGICFALMFLAPSRFLNWWWD
jgi:hypothetical protein